MSGFLLQRTLLASCPGHETVLVTLHIATKSNGPRIVLAQSFLRPRSNKHGKQTGFPALPMGTDESIIL